MIVTNDCLVSVAYMPSSKVLWFQYHIFFPLHYYFVLMLRKPRMLLKLCLSKLE